MGQRLTATGFPAVFWECPHCEERQYDDGRGGTAQCVGCEQMVTVLHVDAPAVCAVCRHQPTMSNSSLCRRCREFCDQLLAKGAIQHQ